MIPAEILALAGISGGSAVIATDANSTRTERIRARGRRPTRLSQMFLVEEGENIDKVIDVTRFQNFFLTLIAVGAYIVMAATVLSQTAIP